MIPPAKQHASDSELGVNSHAQQQTGEAAPTPRLLHTTHTGYDAAVPRTKIVLTKLRVSLAITVLFALAAFVAIRSFAQNWPPDTRIAQASLIFGSMLAVVWVLWLVAINRRAS